MQNTPTFGKRHFKSNAFIFFRSECKFVISKILYLLLAFAEFLYGEIKLCAEDNGFCNISVMSNVLSSVKLSANMMRQGT